MAEVRRRNAEANGHWFEPGTIRFFRSRVGSTLYGGRFFISSERGPDEVRRYSIREAKEDGHIYTVGQFGRFRSWNGAAKAVRRLVKALAEETK